MDNFLNHIKDNIDLRNFIFIKTTSNKAVIFKIFHKYTKCIYISVFDDYIEVSIDKVFDEKNFYKGIERLIIDKKSFNNFNDSLNYIKKNIAI
ncbi:MAG: hypothetical protein ACRDA3_00635 [Peptostreptococcaceae bacterium]